MKERGAIRPGCLVWAALILLVAVFAWKSIDFFVLRPAGVKKSLNEAYNPVRVMRTRNTAERFTRFQTEWRAYRDSTSDIYVQRIATPPRLDGDTVWVLHIDTLHLPVIGPLVDSMKIKRYFV